MKKINYLAIILFVGLCLFALPTQGFAVAGGHGGGTSSGRSSGRSSFGGRSYGGSYFGSRSYGRDSYGYYGPSTGPSSYEQTGFLALAVLSVGGVSAFSIVKNKRQKKRLKAEILSRMSGTVKEKKAQFLEIQKIFMKIQSAWEEETPEKARCCYTDKLFAEHQKVLQKNKADGVRNHTKKVTIQEVGNYRQIHENSFAIRIDFRCCDYLVDRKDGRLISGSMTQRQYFSQIWYFDFSEKEKRWQADFIQPIMLD
ncbi:TIM44-like domain-containing protein [Enterococcus faecium]|uniref:TIM44-like domain-containing protein n=1 Tax=Enterococcus faecium TaxID=1352 RepID=UPI00223BC665|nr:TIM44-like domain-containing protein [Enterococcus faecium]MCS8593263.1 hypothetical protein [Enterococcus faecium]